MNRLRYTLGNERMSSSVLIVFVLILLFAVQAVAGANSGSSSTGATSSTSSSNSSNSTEPADSLNSSFSIFPIMFTTPETGFGGGGGLILTREAAGNTGVARSNSAQFFGFYTTKNQSSLILMNELYLAKQKFYVESRVAYSRMPMFFYGIGNNTSRDDEEEFTIESSLLELKPQYRIRSGLRLGVSLILRKSNITGSVSGGLIDTGGLTGAEGGVSIGGGPLLSWDTRDNTNYPYGGFYLLLKTSYFRDNFGSDYSYDVFTADLRKYFQITPGHYLAIQGFLTSNEADVPFYDQARLGDLLRGIYGTRYNDKTMAVAQIEYRFPLPQLWSWVDNFRGNLFIGTGQVASQLDEMKTEELRTSAGWGIRYILDRRERINIRFDVGFGGEGAEVYFQFLEAY